MRVLANKSKEIIKMWKQIYINAPDDLNEKLQNVGDYLVRNSSIQGVFTLSLKNFKSEIDNLRIKQFDNGMFNFEPVKKPVKKYDNQYSVEDLVNLYQKDNNQALINRVSDLWYWVNPLSKK